jgi:hypothetical protein
VLVALGRAGAASDLVFDPQQPHRFALGSEDACVRIYDLRMAGTRGAGGAAVPGAAALAAALVPPRLQRRLARGTARGLDGVSGLAWGAAGALVASYRGDDVYMLDAGEPAIAAAAAGAAGAQQGSGARVLARYRGRRNVTTFLKGVALLCDGAYVAAGGDCGHVFVWHARSGALAARVAADNDVVNAVAPHPHGLPLLAVSGIDSDAKIVAPGDGRKHAWQLPRRRPGDAAAAAAAASEASSEEEAEDEAEEEEEEDAATLELYARLRRIAAFAQRVEPGGGGGGGADEAEAEAQRLWARLMRRFGMGEDDDEDGGEEEEEDDGGSGSGGSDEDEEGDDDEEADERSSDDGDAADASQPEAAAAAEAAPSAAGRRRTRSEPGAPGEAVDGVVAERSPRQRRDAC